jgi:hypothetical protein
MHRMMVACAAAAMLAALSAPEVAMARGGGGHGGGGHGGGGHGGGGYGGGMGHGGMGGMGGMGHGGPGFGGGRGFAVASAHPAMAFGHGFHGRHHVFVRNRFAFVGGGYGYSGCYTRVWTYWGWVWRNVCTY